MCNRINFILNRKKTSKNYVIRHSYYNLTKLRSQISKEAFFLPAYSIQFHRAADFQAEIRQNVYSCCTGREPMLSNMGKWRLRSHYTVFILIRFCSQKRSCFLLCSHYSVFRQKRISINWCSHYFSKTHLFFSF